MRLVLASHFKGVCCYLGLDCQKVLTIEYQKISVFYCMLLRPYFFKPKRHSFILFDQSLFQLKGRDEDLVEVVAFI